MLPKFPLITLKLIFNIYKILIPFLLCNTRISSRPLRFWFRTRGRKFRGVTTTDRKEPERHKRKVRERLGEEDRKRRRHEKKKIHRGGMRKEGKY